jgi:hypothetical protein
MHSIFTTRLILDIQKAIREGKGYYSTVSVSGGSITRVQLPEEYQLQLITSEFPNSRGRKQPIAATSFVG